jgi:membrane protease YdiL (CAAX protease family)
MNIIYVNYINALLSIILALIGYKLFDSLKDMPFNYISKSDYNICKKMNSSMCIRIAYGLMSLIVYFISLYALNFTITDVKVKNTFNDNIKFFKTGSFIGLSFAIGSFLLNYLLGFVKINKFNLKEIVKAPIILSGMLLTGLSEELIFRGILIGFTKPFINPAISVIASAGYFGFVHYKYSPVYGISAFVSGLILGISYVYYGLYWCIGFHSLFNFMETFLYTIANVTVQNKIMAGERKTPDDDGLTTSLLEVIYLFPLLLNFIRYISL